MCGIYGAFRTSPGDGPLTVSDARMMASLAARGPDGRASFRSDRCLLGFSRLAVSAPREPAVVSTSDDGAVRAVMNGEIFNHEELRELLQRHGSNTSRRCDASLIPLLYDLYGPSFVRRINGQFAIALHDSRTSSLYLYRDRLGIKPLFHVVRGDTVWFASEIKALHAALDLELSPEAATDYLSAGTVAHGRTLWSDVQVLEPGSLLRFQDGTVSNETYWRPSGGARNVEELDLAPLLRESVRMRSRPEVPAALLLSGGLDSTLIGALAEDAGLPAYCMGVADFDETDRAKAAASALGMELRVLPVAPPTPDRFLESLWRLEVPNPSTSYGIACAQLDLAERLTADGIKVALSGEGADELFLGYPWDRAAAAHHHSWNLPDGHEVVEALGDNWRVKWTVGVETLGPGASSRRIWQALLDPSTVPGAFERFGARLLNSELRASQRTLATPTADGTRASARRRQVDGLREMQRGPIQHADRIFARSGVEVRVPFLDHRVVDFALERSAARLETAGEAKPMLRQIARSVLPNGVESPDKRGLRGVPRPRRDLLLSWAGALAADPCRALSNDDLRSFIKTPPAQRAAWEVLWRGVVLECVSRVFKDGPRSVALPAAGAIA